VLPVRLGGTGDLKGYSLTDVIERLREVWADPGIDEVMAWYQIRKMDLQSNLVETGVASDDGRLAGHGLHEAKAVSVTDIKRQQAGLSLLGRAQAKDAGKLACIRQMSRDAFEEKVF
jgi:hypothetical protein